MPKEVDTVKLIIWVKISSMSIFIEDIQYSSINVSKQVYTHKTVCHKCDFVIIDYILYMIMIYFQIN